MFKSLHNKRFLSLAVLSAALCSMTLAPAAVVAQSVDNGEPNHVVVGNTGDTALAGADGGQIQPFTTAELEDLVAPVALYPDELLAIVLPAATYPLQIVQAARFLDDLENDDSLQPDEDWDESVVALLNYPEVIDLLNSDLEWTWQLGEAVLNQEEEVIQAVETFRDRALLAGNLETDEHQVVSSGDGAIEITPVDPEVIYVPYYEPEQVVVYQPYPVYHYYPRPYPVYYYPYSAGHHFNSGFFWGITTAYAIGWPSHHLNLHYSDYYSHPYYGYTYFRQSHYYHRPSHHFGGHRFAGHPRHHGDRWRPNRRHGARPVHRSPSFDRGGNDFVRSSGGSRFGRPGAFKPRPGFRGKIMKGVNTRSRDADFRTKVRPAIWTTRDARRPARRGGARKFNATPKTAFAPQNRRSSGEVRRNRPHRDQFSRNLKREPVVQDRSRGNRVVRSAKPRRSVSEPSRPSNRGQSVSRPGPRHAVRTSRPEPVASNRPRGGHARSDAHSSSREFKPSPPPRQSRPASRPPQSRAPESRPAAAASKPSRSDRGRSQSKGRRGGSHRDGRGRRP